MFPNEIEQMYDEIVCTTHHPVDMVITQTTDVCIKPNSLKKY